MYIYLPETFNNSSAAMKSNKWCNSFFDINPGNMVFVGVYIFTYSARNQQMCKK